MESVKISKPEAMSESFRLGRVICQKVCHGVAPRSSEASSCVRSSFCKPAKSSVVATEMSAVHVAEKYRDQTERSADVGPRTSAATGR